MAKAVTKLDNTVVVCPAQLIIVYGLSKYANNTSVSYCSSSLISKSAEASKYFEDFCDSFNYNKQIIIVTVPAFAIENRYTTDLRKTEVLLLQISLTQSQ